jgi:hypothetical protein
MISSLICHCIYSKLPQNNCLFEHCLGYRYKGDNEMITQSRKLRIKPIIKNPLSEKLKEKHQNSLSRKGNSKTIHNCNLLPK